MINITENQKNKILTKITSLKIAKAINQNERAGEKKPNNF